MCGDVILVSIVFCIFAAILCITMYFLFFPFFLCISFFVSLSVSYYFLVASFDGLRPLLVTSHCSLRSLANKLRSFVFMLFCFVNATLLCELKLWRRRGTLKSDRWHSVTELPQVGIVKQSRYSDAGKY